MLQVPFYGKQSTKCLVRIVMFFRAIVLYFYNMVNIFYILFCFYCSIPACQLSVNEYVMLWCQGRIKHTTHFTMPGPQSLC